MPSITIIIIVSVYLPVLMEHAALIMATINEMRKSWRDQLNRIEVIFVVDATDGCAATAAALLFLWPTVSIVAADCILCTLCCASSCSLTVDRHALLLRPFTRPPQESFSVEA